MNFALDVFAGVDRHLQTLEENLLLPAFRQSTSEVADLLADDFKEFGSSGRIFDKPEILRMLRDAAPGQLGLYDFKAVLLAKDVAHVTYISTRATDEGLAEFCRSSIWVCRAGSWKMLFHQGTPIDTQ